MGGLIKAIIRAFKAPKMPAPPPVPKGPSAADISAASERNKQNRRFQRGRASTILSGDDVSKIGGTLGDDTSGLATKKLMGG